MRRFRRNSQEICFAWDYQDPKRGLLRTRVANNWHITKQTSRATSTPRTASNHSRHLQGHHQPGVARADRQAAERRLGRLRRAQQHRHFRRARQRQVRVRDDRPAHDAPLRRQHGRARRVRRADLLRPRGRRLSTKPPPGQRVLAAGARPTSSTRCSTASSRSWRWCGRSPDECDVGFRARGQVRGHRRQELSSDQKARVQEVLAEARSSRTGRGPRRSGAVPEAQGGLDACHLAFYNRTTSATTTCGTSGGSKGRRSCGTTAAPHVHVWVNVADDPCVKLNA